MERLTGSEALGLFEAYDAVYASQKEVEIIEEQVWEEVETWVNSLLEEGYDLSDYTWEEMYEAYIKEEPLSAFSGLKADLARKGLERRVGEVLKGEGPAAKPKPTSTSSSGSSSLSAFSGLKADIARKGLERRVGEFLKGEGPAAKPKPDKGPKDNEVGSKPPIPSATKPITSPKVAPAAAAKGPAIGTTKGGTKFERRAATSAELKAARAAGGGEAGIKAAVTRSQPTQGPSAAKVDPGSVARSMQAFKPVTPTTAVKAAPSTSPAASGSVVPASNAISAKPSSAMSQGAIRNRRLNMEMEYDAYDLVLEYLLSQGHVETVDEAHYVMLEMDAEVIQDIVEERRDPRGRVSSGPMNVYRDSKRKPDKEHSDAVKSYDNEQKKKTPEQKKAELDAYIERQRNR